MAEVVEFVDPGRSRGGRAGDGSSKQRKLFMSSKVSDVFKEAASATKSPVQERDDGLSMEDFHSIFQRVQKLESSQLSWKEKKKFEAERLQALGAKPVKNAKMPIAVGLGMKRKREKLEELKRQEDLSAGNYVKSTSKRKKEFRKPEDRALQVSEGSFKRGVLFVKPLASSEKDKETPRKTGGFKNKIKKKKGHRR